MPYDCPIYSLRNSSYDLSWNPFIVLFPQNNDVLQFVNLLGCMGPRSYTVLLMKNTTFSCSHKYETWIYFVVNLNGAYPKLVPFRPAGRLISPPLLLSVIFNILLSLAMHIVGFILVQRQPWYSMEMHRYYHSLNSSISHSNFYQMSSGPYDRRQIILHSPRSIDFLKSLGKISGDLFSITQFEDIIHWHLPLPVLCHNDLWPSFISRVTMLILCLGSLTLSLISQWNYL